MCRNVYPADLFSLRVLPSPVFEPMMSPGSTIKNSSPDRAQEDNTMAGKIFYRERIKSREGQQTPRFRVVAASDIDLKIFADHFRKKELEQLAKETKAKLIELKRDKKSKSLK